MRVVKTVSEIREQVKSWKSEGLKVALVPTMGYLHEGHMSLIKRASKENDKVVVSIFVNPTQFGPNEDLEDYPRDLEKDKLTCEESGASIIFNPEPYEMYVDGFCTYVETENLTKELCGKSRPIHFRGVCTVVSKLFNIVSPHRAYFGQKDAQQLAVIKRMVKDLNFDVEIIGCPIIRESDGLAKSSRNVYLSLEERKAATILNKALSNSKELLLNGETDSNILKEFIVNEINKENLADIDYVEIVDNKTIEKIDSIEDEVLVAVAVKFGNTRLIDNFIFKGKGEN